MMDRQPFPVLTLVALAATAAIADTTPLLYAPLDGVLTAGFAQGAAVPVDSADAEPADGAGVRGECVHIASDCRFDTAGNFRREAGTIAMWIRPHWPGTEPTGHYLFCLYGGPDVKEPWMANRWSLVASGGRFQAWIWGTDTTYRAALEAPIAAWQPREWHHVALTWHNINSGRDDARVVLYIDGSAVGVKTGIRLDAGAIADTMCIGRDADGSPDYAIADLDELYIYGEALDAAAVRRAANSARTAQTPPEAPSPPGTWRTDWWDDASRCRCQVAVPRQTGTVTTIARTTFDVQSDLSALGLHTTLDPASVRVVPVDPQSGQCGSDAVPLPAWLDAGTLCVRLDATGANASAERLHVYFDTIELDFSVPLLARPRRRAAPSPAPDPGGNALPDYATETYGDAWDFAEDDLEGIDQWGNKPWCLKNRKVEGGLLSFDVSEDPWFIWGNMWGQVAGTQRPVAIDLGRYPILTMRVRQSCPSATWQLYGRPVGRDDLLRHEFEVKGQSWQTVRIDLRGDARWGGVLQAFRIDPTAEVADAHIDIDWVRLTHETRAERKPVEVLPTSAVEPASVLLSVGAREADAGSAQAVTARLLSEGGDPISGYPVTLRVVSAGNGRLVADPARPTLELSARERRGLTDANGECRVVHVASEKAGRHTDRLHAVAEFAEVESATVEVTTTPLQPDHYRVTPSRAVIVRQNALPLSVTAQLVDRYDNALPVPGRRVRFVVPEGAVATPGDAVTDARGSVQTAVTADAAERWVLDVRCRDESGLAGESGRIALALDTPLTNRIRRLPNGYFAFPDGKVFVPLGGFYANWVQRPTPDGEWADLASFTYRTDDDKRRWMQFLADNGVTAMRFMLRTHHAGGTEGMDVGGKVNAPLFAEALRYMDLARESGLLFLLVVHDDYNKPVYVNDRHFRQYALPRFAGLDLDALPACQRRFVRDRNLLTLASEKYTDPDAIASQDMYARELVRALRHNPQVFAYELENEMVSCPGSWANHAIEVIRGEDPNALVCVSHGGGGLHTADPLWWCRNVSLDFYTYHLYPHGRRTTPDMDYGIALDVLTRYGRMAGTCFLGESAGDQFRLHPDVATRRWVMRDIIWFSLTNGNPGVFFWNARGPEIREFKMARDAMHRLDVATFRRAKPEIGIDVTHPLDDDRFFRSETGAKAYAMMGRYSRHYLDAGIGFDFTVEPRRYAKSATLAEFAPPAPERRPFTIGAGWQLNCLARDDWSELLIYVRNIDGTDQWNSEMGGRGAWTQYLRTRRSAQLRLTLSLPIEGTYQAHVYDLDALGVEARIVAPDDTLDLGTTDHDFALVLKQQ